jgi:hypothetical protein
VRLAGAGATAQDAEAVQCRDGRSAALADGARIVARKQPPQRRSERGGLDIHPRRGAGG